MNSYDNKNVCKTPEKNDKYFKEEGQSIGMKITKLKTARVYLQRPVSPAFVIIPDHALYRKHFLPVIVEGR
jgi:hypothetical protein